MSSSNSTDTPSPTGASSASSPTGTPRGRASTPDRSDRDPAEPDDLPPGRLFRFGAAFYLLVALAGIVAVGIREGRIPLSLFLSTERWPLDVALGVLGGGSVVAIWRALSRVTSVARRLEVRLASLVGSLGLSEAFGLALLSGFAEELLFRGAIQPAWGYWPATILFALLHTGRERLLWWWTFSAFLAGALFGLLFAETGNLAAPITAHVVVNALQLPRLLRRTRGGS